MRGPLDLKPRGVFSSGNRYHLLVGIFILITGRYQVFPVSEVQFRRTFARDCSPSAGERLIGCEAQGFHLEHSLGFKKR